VSARQFPHLDELRQGYDRDVARRSALVDLQWRAGLLEAWLRELPEKPRLLELGPGTGQLAQHAQNLGADVLALDLSPENVARCRARGVRAVVGNFRALDDEPDLGTFDGVYSINALLHVPRAEHAGVFASVRRHLAPRGGLLLASWGGTDSEGIYEKDTFEPPRFFSLYDDATFARLEPDGFDVIRRELLPDQTPDGLHPQVLVARRKE
jgi:SAM-dependent methyltransferase